MKKIQVTPEMAKEWLKKNTQNRPLSIPRINRYSADMLRGDWKQDTYEFIKFDSEGKVLDGQHRLHAVCKANIPVWLHVAFDVPNSVHDVLDTGKNRNASDVFRIEGIKKSNTIPSIIQTYELLVKQNNITGGRIDGRKTNQELLDIYYSNEVFWQETGRKAHNWYNAIGKILQPSHIGGFYAFFYWHYDANKSERFMDQLCTGIGIENKIIAMLRNKLIADKVSIKKMPISLKTGLIIKAFNCFVTNQSPKILKLSLEKEGMPTLVKSKSN